MTGGPLSPVPGTWGQDDGASDPDLLHALLEHRAGRLGRRGLVEVLREQRLLVPLMEVDADQLEQSADPCAGQARAVAAVSLTGPDSTSVGLAFTGIAQLGAWHPGARPMPAAAPRVARAVIGSGGRSLVVDRGSPTAVEISGVALLRLASGEAWPAPWDDPQVQRAVVAELAPALAAGDLAVRLLPGTRPADPSGAPGQRLLRPDHTHDDQPPRPDHGQQQVPLEPGRDDPQLDPVPELLVQVRFRPGTRPRLAAQRAELIGRRLGGSELLRAVLDGSLALSWTIAD